MKLIVFCTTEFSTCYVLGVESSRCTVAPSVFSATQSVEETKLNNDESPGLAPLRAGEPRSSNAARRPGAAQVTTRCEIHERYVS